MGKVELASSILVHARGFRDSVENAVSLPRAIAMSIMPKEKDRPFLGVQTISAGLLDRRLRQGPREDFRSLVGGAVLSALVGSLEIGAEKGWRDDLFLEQLNLYIVSPIAVPTVEIPESSKAVDLMKETRSIHETLEKDGSFVSFLKTNAQGEWNKLPGAVQAFLKQNPFWEEALKGVIPLFEEASNVSPF
ncbi:MAG: hypothetical protein Q7R51_00985 [bacterium]|nr:hypothetical protein [bacterium]